MNCAFVGTDEDAAAAEIAQLTHGGFGLFAQPHQPLGIVAQDTARFGQRPLLR